MHHFTAHELADAWELRAGLTDASAWDRAASVAACLRECAAELRSAATPQPEAQPQWQLPAQRLVQWLHCMSYNDSYFGEPAGYLKQCVNELKHLLPPNEVRAAPSVQAEQDASGFNVPVQPIGGE